MNAPRLLGKPLADVFSFSRHADEGLVQLRHGRRKHGHCRLFRGRDRRRTALHMRRRWQLAHARSLTLRTMHQMTLALIAERLARSKPAFEMVSLLAEKIEDYHAFWLVVPGAEVESACLAARDFKSLVSTNFTIRAFDLIV